MVRLGGMVYSATGCFLDHACASTRLPLVNPVWRSTVNGMASAERTAVLLLRLGSTKRGCNIIHTGACRKRVHRIHHPPANGCRTREQRLFSGTTLWMIYCKAPEVTLQGTPLLSGESDSFRCRKDVFFLFYARLTSKNYGH